MVRAKPSGAAWRVASMGAAALKKERVAALCLIAALTAVLAPLLVLFGLKYGLIDTIAERLIEDVRNREIRIVGSARLDEDWFDAVRARPDVEFVIPNTRSISASFNLVQSTDRRHEIRGLQMIPTGDGDPLIEGAVPIRDDHEIVLSALAAERLSVTAGGEVRARVQRTRDAGQEGVWLTLRVVDVARDGAFVDEAAFVSQRLLVATEDYRDGHAVDAFGWPGSARVDGKRLFARFRLYASSIYEVPALRDHLNAQGLDIRTQAGQIEAMQAFERRLNVVFGIVAAISGLGFVAAFSASLAANVDRNRRSLSILRLIGFSQSSVAAFPVAQALIVTAIAGAISALGYLAVAQVLNALFSSDLRSDELVCKLEWSHVGIASSLVLATALVSSIWASSATISIEPTEGLRDV